MDNHDQSRFLATGVGAAQAKNAIVANFLIAGIPTVYYGLEQGIAQGTADPYNRNALWHSGYSTDSPNYVLIKRLNAIRKALGNETQFHKVAGKTISVTDNEIAIERNQVVIALTKVSHALDQALLDLAFESGLTSVARFRSFGVLECQEDSLLSQRSGLRVSPMSFRSTEP